jgi:hypothetical protein
MPSFSQVIKDWTIRRKILTGFGLVLMFTALLGWRALHGLGQMSQLGNGDFAGAERIVSDSRSAILMLLGVTIGLGVALALTLSRLIILLDLEKALAPTE